jgi:S1-C subfamily serine protease
MIPRAWVGLRFHLVAAPEGHSAPFLFIDSVVPGGPAADAGLRKQDLIVELDGKRIPFRSDVEALKFFASLRVGKKLRTTLVRNQERREIVVTPIALPESARAAWESNLARAAAAKRAH